MDVIRTLIMHDGGLPGLAGLATVDRPERCVVWHLPHRDRAIAARQQECISRQMQVMGAETYVVGSPLNHSISQTDMPQSDSASPIARTLESCAVLMASAAARAHGCHRVLWPANAADQADDLSALCQQAVLLQHLANQGLHENTARSQLIEIDIPFADCTDLQIADLAIRSGVSLDHVYWCVRQSGTACRECAACQRWSVALTGLGMVVKP